jgi:hypothetical protein
VKTGLKSYFPAAVLPLALFIVPETATPVASQRVPIKMVDLRTVPRNVHVNPNTGLAYAAMYLTASTAVVNSTSAKLIATV